MYLCVLGCLVADIYTNKDIQICSELITADISALSFNKNSLLMVMNCKNCKKYRTHIVAFTCG